MKILKIYLIFLQLIICLVLLRKIKFLYYKHLYVDFENNEREEINSACDFVSGEVSEDSINDSEIAQGIDDNRAKLKDN